MIPEIIGVTYLPLYFILYGNERTRINFHCLISFVLAI